MVSACAWTINTWTDRVHCGNVHWNRAFKFQNHDLLFGGHGWRSLYLISVYVTVHDSTLHWRLIRDTGQIVAQYDNWLFYMDWQRNLSKSTLQLLECYILTELWLKEVSHGAKEHCPLHTAIAMVAEIEVRQQHAKRCQSLLSLIAYWRYLETLALCFFCSKHSSPLSFEFWTAMALFWSCGSGKLIWINSAYTDFCLQWTYHVSLRFSGKLNTVHSGVFLAYICTTTLAIANLQEQQFKGWHWQWSP